MHIEERIKSSVPPEHLSRVEPALATFDREIKTALLHLTSAAQIISSDPVGAYQLAYDAARKGIQAFISQHGFRVLGFPYDANRKESD